MMVARTRGTACHRAVLAGALLLLGAAGPAAADDACTTSNGNQVLTNLLNGLNPLLNADWPSVAKSAGVDPLDLGNISAILEHSDCSSYCWTLAAPVVDWCHFDVQPVTITGLSNLILFTSPSTANTKTAAPGNVSCPYNPPKSFSNSCSFQGQASESVGLPVSATFQISSPKAFIETECDWGVYSSSEKIWPESGTASIQCTVTGVVGFANMNECSGLCQSGSPSAAIEALQPTSVAVKPFSISDISCTVTPKNPQTFSDLNNAFASAVATAAWPHIENALNTLLKSHIPYPATCN